MPVQTTLKNVYFKDGTKVEIKEYGAGSYTDLGAIDGDVTCTLNYDMIEKETANAGKLASRIKNMTISGAFNLIHWDVANINRLGGGMFNYTTTAAGATTSIPNQIIAANWNDNVKYELVMYTSSSDSTKLRFTTKPTLTSVTLDASGTPEVLAEIGAGAAGDYMVVADADSYSGWSIMFNSAGMSTGTPKTKAITIDYGSNTPVATEAVSAGTSGKTLNAYQLKFTHTDDNSLKRVLEIFAADTNSGGIAFNFGSATADDVEALPIQFTGKCDSTLTNGYQLFTLTIDNGAQ